MAWYKKKKSEEEQLAVNQSKAIDELVLKLNEISPSDNWRNYAQSMVSGGYDNADNMHNIFRDFGYPETLTFHNFWNMYRRFGVAKTVIETQPKLSWLHSPLIKSDNAQFIAELDRLVNDLDFWNRLKGVDIRQRVGKYAGLFLRVKDGKTPEKPLTMLNGVDSIMELKPLYESQLLVDETITDPNDPYFGQPKKYTFIPSADGNRNKNDNQSIEIHPSRIIPIAEGADDGSIYGVPALESVYNDLMDLRKISGAGGEGFYQNTRNAPFFEAAGDFQMPTDTQTLDKLEAAVDDWLSKHRKRLMLQGVKPHYPNIQLSTPKEFAQNSINNIAAGSDTPSAILVGQQTGRLASEKDSDYFLTIIQARKINFCTSVIKTVIDRLIKYKVLPSAEYKIVWDDLLASSDSAKFTLSKMMAEMNKWSYDAGGSPIFTEQQIQEKAGYDEQFNKRNDVGQNDRSGDKLTKPDTGTNIDD